MISSFRNFAKSKWAIGLLVLVALSLLVTGGSQMDILGQLSPGHVITAGTRSQNGPEFSRTVERLRTQLGQQAGRPVSNQDLVDENVLSQFLSSQTTRLGFLSWAWERGIRPGQQLVVKDIQGIEAFFNPITGKFDPQRYREVLAEQQLTPEDIETEARDQYAMQHYGTALFAGARLPRVYGAVLAGQALESREGRYFVVTQAMAGTTPPPTDAQLTAFMNENAARLRSQETRTVSVVLFDGAAGAEQPITEEAIRERFEFRKDALSTPERRTFTTLTAPTREAAQRITAALRAGQTAAQAGATANIQPASFADQPRSAISDPAVATAVFAATPGQVSDPIQARLGFAVIKVDSVAAGSPATLEGARSQIVEELRAEGARQAVYKRVEDYEAARNAGRDMAAAAAQVGGRIITLPPFTREGRLANGQPLPAPPQLIENAWTLPKGGESEVIDAGQNQYFVIRVDDVTPARLPALADVRDQLAQAWTARQNASRLSQRAETLAGQIRSGQDIAAVAREAGAELRSTGSVGRTSQAELERLGQGVARGLFGARRNDTFAEAQAEGAYVVGRLDQIRPAVPALAAPMVEQIRPRMNQETLNGLAQIAFTSAAERERARSDMARARAALGLPAEDAAPASGATPAPAQ